MAILHVPVRMRTYDLNPQGSATSLVTMGQDNPFDRRVIAKVRDLRGIDLGDAETATPLPTTNSSEGFWGALTSFGATLVPKLAANLISPPGDSGAIPGTNPIPAVQQQAAPSMPNWVIPAGFAAGALLLILAMRRR